jgi:uncharacterized protein (DUF2252 family)
VLLGRPFVMRGLQPSEDRLDLGRSGEHPDEVREALCTMAALLAWAQLRASGRSGAAPADALAAFAGKARRERVLALARGAAERVEEDWTDYCRAYDAGRFAALVPAHP